MFTDRRDGPLKKMASWKLNDRKPPARARTVAGRAERCHARILRIRSGLHVQPNIHPIGAVLIPCSACSPTTNAHLCPLFLGADLNYFRPLGWSGELLAVTAFSGSTDAFDDCIVSFNVQNALGLKVSEYLQALYN